MPNKVINLGIVGVGKIVRDQHLPSIASSELFKLTATASRNASVDGTQSYDDIQSMLNAADLDAVALCMPPQYRQEPAQIALESGKHVLLEKPPGATVSEVEHLARIAHENDVSLYATWHSRHGAAVETARALLAKSELQSASISWKEDVQKWHPGQQWIWQAGGLGVFDPGINGLSILTHCVNSPIYVTDALLEFPVNKAAPIAANVNFKTVSGVEILGQFDWRPISDETWNIDFQTTAGLLQLKDGGAKLFLDGDELNVSAITEFGEYQSIYTRFAKLIESRSSDVDLAPLKLVADAFLLGERKEVEAFNEF